VVSIGARARMAGSRRPGQGLRLPCRGRWRVRVWRAYRQGSLRPARPSRGTCACQGARLWRACRSTSPPSPRLSASQSSKRRSRGIDFSPDLSPWGGTPTCLRRPGSDHATHHVRTRSSGARTSREDSSARRYRPLEDSARPTIDDERCCARSAVPASDRRPAQDHASRIQESCPRVPSARQHDHPVPPPNSMPQSAMNAGAGSVPRTAVSKRARAWS
jgi:hypothetical protein